MIHLKRPTPEEVEHAVASLEGCPDAAQLWTEMVGAATYPEVNAKTDGADHDRRFDALDAEQQSHIRLLLVELTFRQKEHAAHLILKEKKSVADVARETEGIPPEQRLRLVD